MILSCVVVDDEPLAISLLENYISQTPFLNHQHSFDNPVEALSYLTEYEIQLVFLDIQMPQLTGFDLAKMITGTTRIIYTTAFKEYAYESYQTHAIDYLLKPIDYQQFLRATNKALQWFEMAESNRTQETISQPINSIFVKSDYKLIRVEVEKIKYICGLKDYVKIYVEDKSTPIIALMTMKATEELFPVNQFVRVHRSYIVAIDKIQSIEHNNRIVIDKEYIPISDVHKDNFMKCISFRSTIKNK